MIKYCVLFLSIVLVSGCEKVPIATDSFPQVSSSNGLIAFIGGGHHENLVIQIISPDGSGRRTIMPDVDLRSNFSAPSWSPDGSQLAFSSNLGGNANHDIYIMNLNGSGLERIVGDSGADLAPAWSPDGRYIAFQAKRDTGWHFDIFVIDRLTGEERNVTNTPELDEEVPVWSPDGSKIVFQGTALGRSNLFLMNADGSNLLQLTHAEARVANETAAWSPDGSLIAFSSNMHQDLTQEVNNTLGAYDIYTIRPDGSDLKRLTSISDAAHAVRWPSWSPDGQFLVAELVEINRAHLQREWYLVTFNADGSHFERLPTQLGGRVPRWSPK